MKTLRRDKAAGLWNKWWSEMRIEWFKVEVLQDYRGEDAGPSLDAWLRGNKAKSVQIIQETDCSAWIQACREKLEQGVKLTRVHILELPLTPYIQWELQHYKYVNIPKCGEEVYLLNRLEVVDLEVPDGDVMIFDKKRVVMNTYNERGLMTHQTFYNENDDISQFLRLRKKLKKIARHA